MDAEMRHHVDLEADELVRQGVTPDEARRRALIAFGGIQQRKEDALDDGTIQWLESLRRNVLSAARTLRRSPSFTITATLALALAIAVDTTLFTFLDAVLNPPIGAKRLDRLYTLKYFTDGAKAVDFRARERALEASATLHAGYTAWFVGGVESAARGGNSTPARFAKVRPNFFPTLGVVALEGRLTPGTDAGSIDASIIISSNLREQLFPRGEPAVGSTILLDGKPRTIVGVTQRYAAMGSLDFDVWKFTETSAHFKIVRLKDGVTLSDAERQLAQLAAQLALNEGAKVGNTAFQLIPEKRPFHVKQFHVILIGSGLAILIVACTNLANLQLARGLTRSAELALRSSLGASRWQIVTQLMLENALLGAGALVLALLLALMGNEIVRIYVPPSAGEYVILPPNNWRMVTFACVAAVVGVITIGLLPAVRASRVNLNSLLKGRTGTGSHRRNHTVYGLLVIVQIALTLPLTTMAVLAGRSALQMASTDYMVHERYGYDPRPLVNITVSLPVAADSTKIALRDYSDVLLSRVTAIPGVVSATVIADAELPVGAAMSVDDEDGAMRDLDVPLWRYNLVSDSYVTTFGYSVVKGVDLNARAHVDPVVLMDERSAKTLWPRSEPVRRLIKFGTAHTRDVPMMRVEGIVRNRLTGEAREIQDIESQNRVGNMYRLITEADSVSLGRFHRQISVVVRTSGSAPAVAQALRRALQGDSPVPVVMLQTQFLGIESALAVVRFVTSLLSVFGLLALGLSSLGVYAIVAQSVADRRREVAVRMSLGATPRRIVSTLLRDGNVILLAGVAIGLMLTTTVMAALDAFNLEGRMVTAPFFAAMCVTLFVVMVLVALVPALRATRLNPMEILRAE